MLKRFFLFGFLALLVPTMTACDSEGDGDGNGNGGGGGNNGNGTLTATADGSSFQSELVVFTFESGVLAISGITNADGSDGSTQRQILLTVPNAAVGTFNIGPSSAGTQAIYVNAQSTDPTEIAMNTYTANFILGSGQIVINELSASGASGTFSFTGANTSGGTAQVTNGQFDVTN